MLMAAGGEHGQPEWSVAIGPAPVVSMGMVTARVEAAMTAVTMAAVAAHSVAAVAHLVAAVAHSVAEASAASARTVSVMPASASGEV